MSSKMTREVDAHRVKRAILSYSAIQLLSRFQRGSKHRVKIVRPNNKGHVFLGRNFSTRLEGWMEPGISFGPAVFDEGGQKSGEAVGSLAHWLQLDIGDDSLHAYKDEEHALSELTLFVEWSGITHPTDVVLSRGSLTAFWLMSELIAPVAWRSFAGQLDAKAREFGLLARHDITADLYAQFAVPGPDVSDPEVINASYIHGRVGEIPWDDLHRSLDNGGGKSFGTKGNLLTIEKVRERTWTSCGSWCRLLCTFRPRLTGHADHPDLSQMLLRHLTEDGAYINRWFMVPPPGAHQEAFLKDFEVLANSSGKRET